VSLKGQASELGLVLASELDGPIAMAPLAQATPLVTVPAVVLARVQAIMVGPAAVEALVRDPVAVDTFKSSFSNKLEPEPNMPTHTFSFFTLLSTCSLSLHFQVFLRLLIKGSMHMVLVKEAPIESEKIN